MEFIATFSLAVSALYKSNLYLVAKKILKMSLLCNKVKFDRVPIVFCQHTIYLSPVKLHDRSCETSFQSLIDGNLGNVSAGILTSMVTHEQPVKSRIT